MTQVTSNQSLPPPLPPRRTPQQKSIAHTAQETARSVSLATGGTSSTVQGNIQSKTFTHKGSSFTDDVVNWFDRQINNFFSRGSENKISPKDHPQQQPIHPKHKEATDKADEIKMKLQNIKNDIDKKSLQLGTKGEKDTAYRNFNATPIGEMLKNHRTVEEIDRLTNIEDPKEFQKALKNSPQAKEIQKRIDDWDKESNVTKPPITPNPYKPYKQL